jgi:RNA polymerase sigma factor (TIGR02999 family)
MRADPSDSEMSASAQSTNRVAALVPLVYEELRRIARRQLRSERPDHTLTTTALVHESYLKLRDQHHALFSDRAHFLAVAAQAMRRILIDYAREHRAARHGGNFQRVELVDAVGTAAEDSETLLAVHEALTRLERLDLRQSRVVECRFFGGMTEQDIASALGVTERTVRRDWTKAKAWLYAELEEERAQ